MARLNDPPQPAGESVDALKRRFVRQNRELARVNSTQSVRIRTLENEVSQLLGENVALREQAIKLHTEISDNSGPTAWAKVDGLKQKLESGLVELGGLLQELGNVQHTVSRQRPIQRTSLGRTSPKRSPNQRLWKNKFSLSELSDESHGRLPAILEDKLFPRRTLEYVHYEEVRSLLTIGRSDELQGISADTGNLTDSPELGPPPVTQFDEEEPITFDPVVEKKPTRIEDASALGLSANLEVRKRRRESFLSDNTKDGHDNTKQKSSTNAKSGAVPVLKSGAKRKLNIRNQEEKQLTGVSSDDFNHDREKFDAAPVAVKPKANAKDTWIEQRPISSRNSREQGGSVTIKDYNSLAPRKILGPKSVNADPQSPAKLARTAVKDKALDKKDDIAKQFRDRNRPRDRPPTSKMQKVVKEIEIAKTEESTSADLPPKTPGLPDLDLFSPTASDPSEPRPDLQDTPPPPDLGPDTGTGSFGRASRRPRGSVSYAEPNLRDKMRRPTKLLIDAVGAEESLRQAAANKTANQTTLEQESEKQQIKREETTETQLNWKTKPLSDSKGQQQREQAETTSPLGIKAAVPVDELPATVRTDRGRRTSNLVREDGGTGQGKPVSGAATAIAALSNATSRARSETVFAAEEDEKIDQVSEQQPTDRTSIFDFTSSSPEYLDRGGKVADESYGAAKSMRVSRRHSSVPAVSDHGKGSITVSRRRRETLLGSEQDPEEGTEKSARPELRPTKSTTVLERGAAAVEETGPIMGRGERAASRRRSMMV